MTEFLNIPKYSIRLDFDSGRRFVLDSNWPKIIHPHPLALWGGVGGILRGGAVVEETKTLLS